MQTSNPDIDRRLRQTLAVAMRTQQEQLTPSVRFVSDIHVDSLDVVEALMAVEDEFEIVISDEEAEGLETYHQALSFVSRKLAEREGRSADEAPSGLLEDIPASSMSPTQLGTALCQMLHRVESRPDAVLDWSIVGPLVGEYRVSISPEMDGSRIKAWRACAYGEEHSFTANPVGHGHDVDQLHAVSRALVDRHMTATRAAATTST